MSKNKLHIDVSYSKCRKPKEKKILERSQSGKRDLTYKGTKIRIRTYQQSKQEESVVKIVGRKRPTNLESYTN